MKLVPIKVTQIKAVPAFIITCLICGGESYVLEVGNVDQVINKATAEGWYGFESSDETCSTACPSCVSSKHLKATEKEHALIKKLRESDWAYCVITPGTRVAIQMYDLYNGCYFNGWHHEKPATSISVIKTFCADDSDLLIQTAAKLRDMHVSFAIVEVSNSGEPS
ncbi:hypothetical protein HWQ46_27095 [Shewanella sp. D64]|uniref:hypothetical protein n=1 Tax=unclassified Shewanella TaxID=196818 RepID=UPI0022BA5D95|nr:MULTISPECIES: hypothetical protein [unclassified Shewanella]MEC4729165.1 hypothetical protein [Shewanella sp. D64]MEC4740952.1 hypothetical protein [Shewanella sp. E94]WBJ95298.1 hypothetical protein HWQ47_26515 [Shewanella sp. MTB7]